MNDRIQLILKTENISASKFADEIGVQRSGISHILSGRNNPSLDFIQKILKRFPDISSDWIISGKGSMYKNPDLFSSVEEQKSEKSEESGKIFNSKEDIQEENEITFKDNETIETNELLKGNTPLPSSKQKDQIKKETQPISIKKEERNSHGIVMKAGGKKVERIIIFYSDKSFIEYTPE
ncbi:MAG: helix-turn-helix transcriptional regulator [Bacteroidales bacterium]